jgi:hypothetical protein
MNGSKEAFIFSGFMARVLVNQVSITTRRDIGLMEEPLT